MSLVVADKDQGSTLLCRVIFDVLKREQMMETLSAHPGFLALGPEGPSLTHILWVQQPSIPQAAPSRKKRTAGGYSHPLGLITLTPRRLILECLAQTSTTTAREALLKVTGSTLRYRITTYENLASALQKKTAREGTIPPGHLHPHLEPEFFKSYFEVHWIHEKIPALDGLTPLQCARSRRKKDRDRLATILATFKKSSPDLYDFNRLIDILGFKNHPLLRGEHIARQTLKAGIMATIDRNLRFILAINKSGIAARDCTPLRRLAEGNVILQGIIPLLEQEERVQTGLSTLAKISEQLEEVLQILRTEALTLASDQKMVQELIDDPTWNHRQAITMETIETAAQELQKTWRENIDRKIIRPNSPLTALLSKLPAIWIATIQDNLGLIPETTKRKNIKMLAEGLSTPFRLRQTVERLNLSSPPAVRALKIVYAHSGPYPYRKLVDLWGSEEKDGYFWNQKKPTSPLGLLRSHGLLFVGQLKKGESPHKIAVLPVEIRAKLSFLEDMVL